jgi:dipeptidyl aminopeptidase/acylaminoacyl peptidase
VPVAPYGSWPSPLTSEVLVQKVVSLSDVRASGDTVWWNEGRPQEAGRHVLVRTALGVDRAPVDVLPEPFSARTRVHEYGGGAYTVHGQSVFFSNFGDQRLWRLDPGQPPRPLTAEPAAAGSVRFADGVVTPDGQWVVCVRERHEGEVVNDLVAVPASGEGEGDPVVLAQGRDFFAAPRLSSDGRLAWLCWDHPNMPWDGTELWVGDVSGAMTLRGARRVSGGADESISQPRWSPDGVLHWISDRTGWWNLYADDGEGGEGGRPLAPIEAEFARPDWVFGQSSYTFLPEGRLVAAWSQNGFVRMGVVHAGRADPLPVPFTDVASLQGVGPSVVAIAASSRTPPAVVSVDVDTGQISVIRSSREAGVPEGAVSEAEPLVFPTTGGRTAHAFFYRSRLEGFEGPSEERPPLIVRSHGGPTGAASTALNVEIQFWTSRGFALVDVDYGGSAGYGREYRQRLDGQWGVVDLDDCVNAALHLSSRGEVDGRRLVVRGGSAGGYTTL